VSASVFTPAIEAALREAAGALRDATALLITAGAGMGVDSGLPDFRGVDGFWAAYPAYAHLKLRFEELANPTWFRRDPALAWGFYGHRRNLYRSTVPHAGFSVLRRWSERMRDGSFVFTSNVDAQFQRAGFDDERIVECHGSIAFDQCTDRCGVGIFAADAKAVDIDAATFRAREPWPRCRRCGALARPNVLMFGDGGWDADRTDAQEERLGRWVDGLRRRSTGVRVVVVECGAGTAIPTVRMFGEQLVAATGGRLVRVNVREPDVPAGHVGVPLGAKAALEAIDRRLLALSPVD
jgi:NAD-dependent SIR2 family protein deacetylase